MLGCGGGLIVVVMAMIFQAWSETRIPSSFWPHFYVIGYLIGFFGPALVEDDLPQPPMRDITPAHDLPDAPLVPLPKPNAPPYRFAEWDDEELR